MNWRYLRNLGVRLFHWFHGFNRNDFNRKCVEAHERGTKTNLGTAQSTCGNESSQHTKDETKQGTRGQ